MVRTRLRILMVLLVLPAIVVIGRLWSLQIDPDSHHLFRIRAEHALLVRVPPARGVILDRNGKLLAGNRAVFDLHFVYGRINPRYIVLDVLCAELARVSAFPLQRDVELHLRAVVAAAAVNGLAAEDPELELVLIEAIPARAAHRIERRLRHREIWQRGFVLRQSNGDDALGALDEADGDDDGALYDLRFRPAQVMRLENTLSRLADALGDSSFEQLDTAVVRALARIDRWVENFVRRDREEGVEEAIWRSKALNARHAYYRESWELVDNVGLAVVTQIEYHPERFPGIEVVDAASRYYPLGEAAGSLIGFLGRLDDPQIAALEGEGRILDAWTDVRSAEAFSVIRDRGLRRTDLVGRTGLESFYDDGLRGAYGMRVVQVDSSMRERALLESLPALDGAPMRTTIDADLQQLLYEALRRRAGELGTRAGSAVVLGLPTAEVLATVGFPSIDPNRLRDPAYTERITRDWQGIESAWLHRPFYHALDPGSVFKVVTAVAALENGRTSDGPLDALHVFSCVSGDAQPFQMRCSSLWGHGAINLYEAFKFSCNNYFYHLATGALDARRLDVWARRFGFGESPGLDLPRRSGHYDRGYLAEPGAVAGERAICSYAIGQQHVRATPMQIARAIAAVALDCRELPTPWLVERGTSRPLPLDRERTGKVLVEGMRRVVSEYGGTVYGKSELERFRFAAKTGSAQFVDHGKRYHASIVGFGPVPDPTIAFVVVLEDSPDGGGEACAPIVRELLDWFAARDRRFFADPGGFVSEEER